MIKKIILLLLLANLFGQTSKDVTLKILSIDLNPKLLSPDFNSSLIRDKVKKKPWLLISVKYEINSEEKAEDKTYNKLIITGDFVAPYPKNKKKYYVFSKFLSYSKVAKKGVFYSAFFISPNSISNYFSSASGLAKNLFARLKFKLNGKTLEKQTVYINRGKIKKRASSYSKSKFASEIAPDISDILLSKPETPWRYIQVDFFNRLDEK